MILRVVPETGIQKKVFGTSFHNLRQKDKRRDSNHGRSYGVSLSFDITKVPLLVQCAQVMQELGDT